MSELLRNEAVPPHARKTPRLWILMVVQLLAIVAMTIGAIFFGQFREEVAGGAALAWLAIVAVYLWQLIHGAQRRSLLLTSLTGSMVAVEAVQLWWMGVILMVEQASDWLPSL